MILCVALIYGVAFVPQSFARYFDLASDNFEKYSITSDLDCCWTITNNPLKSCNTTLYEGAVVVSPTHSIKFWDGSDAGWTSIERTFDLQTAGLFISFWVIAAQTNGWWEVFIGTSDHTIALGVAFGTDGFFYYSTELHYEDSIPYTIAHWYFIEIYINFKYHNYTAMADDVLICEDVPFENIEVGYADLIQFTTAAASKGIFYVDDVQVSAWTDLYEWWVYMLVYGGIALGVGVAIGVLWYLNRIGKFKMHVGKPKPEEVGFITE